MNLVSPVSTSSSTVQSPIASKSQGILKAPSQNDWTSTGKPDATEHNQNTASSSQQWQKDAVLDVRPRKLVATEEDQEHLKCPEDSVSTRKLVASRNSETESKDNIWPHHLQKSEHGVPHMENVFSIFMKDLDVNAAIRMSVTLHAAVHLGKNCTENLRYSRNSQAEL